MLTFNVVNGIRKLNTFVIFNSTTTVLIKAYNNQTFGFKNLNSRLDSEKIKKYIGFIIVCFFFLNALSIFIVVVWYFKEFLFSPKCFECKKKQPKNIKPKDLIFPLSIDFEICIPQKW